MPNTLQIAIKAGLASAVAWAICQFFDFTSTSFFTVMMSINVIMLGLGMQWILVLQGFLALMFAVMGTVLILVLFGDNYISFFIAILFVALLEEYLEKHGFITNFFVMMAMASVAIINGNSSDPVTFAFNLLVSVLIAFVVAIIFNRLFWPKMAQEDLEKQLKQNFNNSHQLTEIMFNGYLQNNLNYQEANRLRIDIFKGIQGSKKQLKIGSLDPTNTQVGKRDWMKIINTEQQISLHLSAILRLIQNSQGITLSEKLESDLTHLSVLLKSTFLQMADVMVSNSSVWDLSPLNHSFLQFKETLKEVRSTDIIETMPLSERLRFYSIVHRLEKLIREINEWGSKDQIQAFKEVVKLR